MPLTSLNIVVPNIDEVLEHFDRIRVFRSTTGLSGMFIEVTTAGTRIVLEAGVTYYQYDDLTGAPTYYYRTTFYNQTSGLESSQSEPMLGSGDPALAALSVDELKQYYLFGIDLTDENGDPMPDGLFIFYIKEAFSWLEHKLDMPLRPVTYTAERYDYIRQEYQKWMWIQLDNYPLLDVTEVRIVLDGQLLATFDAAQIIPYRESGQINIRPRSGQILLGASGAMMPFALGQYDWLPQAFEVDYSAGFPAGQVPDVIRGLIGKLAAMGPLAIAGDLLFGAGIAAQTVSLDQLMTNVQTARNGNNSVFSARIREYWLEVKSQLDDIRRYYKGIPLRMG